VEPFRVSCQTISIIIPTRDRPDVLLEVLLALEKQSVNKDYFEVLIVDDGSRVPVEGVLDKTQKLQAKVFRQGRLGPAKARNVGIQHAKHDLLLFINDDTIPAGDLLAQHLLAHSDSPLHNIAVLGKVEWSSEIPCNFVMRHITEYGHQQFAFNDFEHGSFLGFLQFYTANLSIKRKFLHLSKERFNEEFVEACYEDLELGYRLQERHKLRILYHEPAVVFHKHQIDLDSFYRRQHMAGRMKMIFARLHPDAFSDLETHSGDFPSGSSIPQEFAFFFSELESLRLAVTDNEELSKLLEKLEHRFLLQVFEFALQSGISYYREQLRRQ
jgi:glycosyltransferase involved in cell wall biosynthesis